MLNEEFLSRIYAVVEEIPYGKVATYGQIARLSGYDKNSRLVGRALSYAYEGLPCHRVVNSNGRTALGWREQKDLLLNEKIKFKSNGNVDLEACQWQW